MRTRLMSQLYEQSCCSSLMKGCLVFLDQIPYPLWVARVRKAIAARTDVDIPDDLSRSPKDLQQLSEPEVFGGHAGLATRVLRLQRQNPGRGISG